MASQHKATNEDQRTESMNVTADEEEKGHQSPVDSDIGPVVSDCHSNPFEHAVDETSAQTTPSIDKNLLLLKQSSLQSANNDMAKTLGVG
jgi:hypothetical protein